MPTTVSLSRAILGLAAWVAPPSRRTMCQAMRAELDVLDGGRLSWALGGLASAVGWRMRVDGPFWIVVLALTLPVWSRVTFYAEIPIYHMLDGFGSLATYGYWLLQKALLCALLAAWRPRLAVSTAIIYALASQATSALYWIYVLRWTWDERVHIMDAPPVVGISANLCWCLIGAWAGATLRRTLARPSPAGPA
jgi:hypothetical protein